MNRRKLLFILLFLILSRPVVAGGFGPPKWGENESGIRARGGSSLVDESSPDEGMKALFINDRVAGLDAWAIYLLSRDRLVQTRYLFAQEHLSPEDFFDEYTQVERALRRKYGEPVESGEHWRNGPRPEESNLGRMIAVGEAALISRWEKGDTVITHILRGESLDVDHEINFVSKGVGKAERRVMDRIRPPKSARF